MKEVSKYAVAISLLLNQFSPVIVTAETYSNENEELEVKDIEAAAPTIKVESLEVSTQEATGGEHVVYSVEIDENKDAIGSSKLSIQVFNTETGQLDLVTLYYNE